MEIANGVIIQLWFSVPGVWSPEATESETYSPGRHPGGTGFSPAPGGKIFPGVTKGTHRNDRNSCPQIGWKIQETDGASTAELESSKSSRESGKLFR